MSGLVHTLKYPVELLNTSGEVVETITELTLRRLRGTDLTAITNAVAKGQGEALKMIVCRACNIAPATYDRLDALDLTEVGAIASGFIGSALPIGAM